jgi:sterol desaturase/sphingolipid hydroxylase (fatty acid hydroxylase superfamily)
MTSLYSNLASNLAQEALEEVHFLSSSQPYLTGFAIWFVVAVLLTTVKSYFATTKDSGFTHFNVLNVSFSVTLIVLFYIYRRPLHDKIEGFWVDGLDRYGELNLFMGFYALVIGSYLSGALFCAIIDYFNLLPSCKILYKGKRFSPTFDDYVKVSKNLFTNYVLLALPMGYFSFPLVKYLGMDLNPKIPEWDLVLFQIGMFYILEDFFHYWGHRLLHTTWLYQNVHKLHHFYEVPFGLTAVYAHWVEFIFLGICTFLPPLLAVRPHFLTYFTWFVLRQIDAVFTHSGYEIPVPILDLFPSYGGIPFHDYHHKSFNYNYGSRFTYLDKLFGTYKEPPLSEMPEKKVK